MFSLVLQFASCTQKTESFTQVAPNFYFSLAEPSDIETHPPHNALLCKVVVKLAELDSVVFDSKSLLQQNLTTFSFTKEHAFYKMHQRLATGDKIILKTSWEGLNSWLDLTNIPFFLSNSTQLKVECTVVKKLNPALLVEENKQLVSIATDPDLREYMQLKRYLNSISDNPEQHYFNGVYFFEERKGTGVLPALGSAITIQYAGFLLTGEPIDHISGTPNTLQVVKGKEKQLIEGLEIALSAMDYGSKAKVIIPAHLAFGERGSYDGSVPPHHSLVYSLELLQ